jgi:hypothetical protein
MKALHTYLGLGLLLILGACGSNENKTPVATVAPVKQPVELIELKAGKVSNKLTLTG